MFVKDFLRDATMKKKLKSSIIWKIYNNAPAVEIHVSYFLGMSMSLESTIT